MFLKLCLLQFKKIYGLTATDISVVRIGLSAEENYSLYEEKKSVTKLPCIIV